MYESIDSAAPGPLSLAFLSLRSGFGRARLGVIVPAHVSPDLESRIRSGEFIIKRIMFGQLDE